MSLEWKRRRVCQPIWYCDGCRARRNGWSGSVCPECMIVERDPTERECAEFAESASAGLAKICETEAPRRPPVVDEYLPEPAEPEPDRVPWVWQRVFGIE